MTTSESIFKKRELALMSTLALIAACCITVAVIPSFRAAVRDFFDNSSREIIAKVRGQLSATGPDVTVLKIKNKNTISLEIYSTESMTLMAKVPLMEVSDGYFFVKGNATNLALTDVDKDEVSEIVVPTYDDKMVPRLNIFKFNPATQSFDRVNAPEAFQ